MSAEANKVDFRERFQKALVKISELKAQIGEVEARAREPIAIVGMACRFPGGATNPEQFWKVLEEEVDAVRPLPEDRWSPDALEPIGAEPHPGTRWAATIDGVDQFDPAFFGISPRETQSLDPQQRILLEIAWEALERAAIPADTLSGSRTGVFVGVSTADYSQQFLMSGEYGHLDAYTATGSGLCFVAGRISYALGLQGPAVAMDTACSSSLVAIHLACQSLRSRESDLALAGGSNFISSPWTGHILSLTGALSPTGRCRTFDARADGFVRGEGAGMLVLKRLSDALRDGDPIQAVVRGSALNQDGASQGLTAPNVLAQRDLLVEAYRTSGVPASQIGYIEAHGTGTSLGDPIEFEALKEAIGAPRPDGSPIYLGSVKTNVGHLEAAAGMAGLFKIVESMRHQRLPRHLHFRTLNPRISLEGTAFRIPTRATPWPIGPAPRIAGISGFGMSGTNAHVVVEEAPAPPPPAEAPRRPAHLVVLSARTEAALLEATRRYADFVEAQPDVRLVDVATTTALGRVHFEHRLAVVAAEHSKLSSDLRQAAAGSAPASVSRGSLESPARKVAVAFLFTGQGAQYVQMGRGLYQSEPVFREHLDRCDALLRPLLPQPLLSVLFPEEGQPSPIDSTAFTQPALFAIEYALAMLWRSWGIEPAAVLGHSVGEYAAAVIAGVMSLEDGARLIAARGRLMQALPAGGEMAAVRASRARVEPVLTPFEGRVCFGAFNGPDSVVISGEGAAVQEVCKLLKGQGIVSRKLVVSHAFHSQLMEPMLEEFEQVASSLTLRPPSLPLVSNVTGGLVGEEITRPTYWRQHVRQPVCFDAGMKALHAAGFTTFLEVGPNPTLLGMGADCVPAEGAVWLPSLRKGKDDVETLLGSAGRLFTLGAGLDLAALLQPWGGKRIPAPTYAFQRKRYWLPIRPRSTTSAGGHPLLGLRVDVAGRETVFDQRLTPSTHRFLLDHRVFGEAIVPAAAWLEWARVAGAAQLGGAVQVEGVDLHAPLTLKGAAATHLQIHVTPTAEGEARFEIYTQAEGTPAWTRHLSGALRRAELELPSLDLGATRARCAETLEVDSFYSDFAAVGLEYGPTFRGISELHRGEGEALAHLTPPDGVGEGAWEVHPALLDAAFQSLGAVLAARGAGYAYLPFGVTRLVASGPLTGPAWVHARVRPTQSAEVLSGDVTLYAEDGRPLVQIEALQVKRTDPAALRGAGASPATGWVHHVAWRPQPAGSEALTGVTLVVGGQADADRLVAALPAGVARAAGPDLAAALAAEGGPIAAVVYLPAPTAPSGDPIERGRARLEALVAAVPALLRKGVSRLLLPTRTAVATEVGEGVDPVEASVWGLGRVAALEHPELGVRLVDLPPQDPAEDIRALAAELASPGAESQVAWRRGGRWVARLAPGASAGGDRLPLPESPSWQLTIPQRGQLSNLRFEPAARSQAQAGEVEIEVKATGLNFRDVLGALGMYPGDPGPLGVECTGVVTQVGEGVSHVRPGDAVMAIAPACFASHARTDARYVAPIPGGLSFEEAMTLPTTFLTAWYGLHLIGQMKAGESVLIHAAAGGVGQAAIQLAQRAGLTIFATASPSKWPLLQAMGIKHIYHSRNTEFSEAILRDTGGRGVDLVLNSLAGGDFIPRTLATLAPGGRFLEMGKAELLTPAQVAATRPDITYTAFDLGELDRDVLQGIFQQLRAAVEGGELRPLPSRVFDMTQAPLAFRYMAQARHVGKVVLKVPQPRGGGFKGSWLITGGLGALGLKVAAWLVDHGVGHLVLVGRSAPSEAAQAALATLEARGVKVQLQRGDVADPAAVRGMVQGLPQGWPPLSGVIHAAGVLDDALLLQQSWPRFEAVWRPKVAGAWNLHQATRELALEHFVLFSSAASLLGSPGQANYASANAFLDGLAAMRRAEGLPALSLCWGAWVGGGMADAQDERTRKQWEASGMSPMPADQALELMGKLMEEGDPTLGVLPIAWARLRQNQPELPPLLAEVAPKVAARPRSPSQPRAAGGLVGRLKDVPPARRTEVIRAALQGHVARVLGLGSPEEVDPSRPLREMGMDSLMAVELKNAVSADVGKPLPATVIFDFPTIDGLSRHLDGELAPAGAAPPPAPAPVPTPAPTPGLTQEPIAIVGMGCRFPGEVRSPETFWRLLMEQRDAIVEIPKERWDIDAWYDPDLWARGKMYTRSGGFLSEVDQFDAGFFGIRRSEAEAMDPQQRILLEVTWEALEHAGIPADSLMGSQTGVWIGICSNDYAIATEMHSHGAAEHIDPYSGTGNVDSVASGRISYLLGLHGPSISLDTACSSSLVGLHLACQSLRTGESDMALVGGVNLVLAPESTLYFCRLQALAADGRCKSFDESANGYARSEGCAVLVLKRLSEAVRDNDHVYAVVRGSAVNQDGRSNGLTAPSGTAQQAVIRRALKAAGVAPAEITYVETHGTGTALGDPIEASALGAVLAEGRPSAQPVLMGAVKTNIGHAEAAAGVASLLKAALVLHERTAPANLHFRTPSPYIPWSELPLKVVTEPTPLAPPGGRLLAGVSAFGFSGTNAHAVLENPPEPPARSPAPARATQLLVLSARSADALRAQARQYASFLSGTLAPWIDVCYTAALGRTHYKHRLAVAAASPAEASAQLRAWLDGGAGPRSAEVGGAPPRVGLIFPGELDLHLIGAGDPLVAGPLAALTPALEVELERPLAELLRHGPTTPIERAVLTLGSQVALAQGWQQLGVAPEVLVGRGLGCFAALVVGGCLSLDAALRLVVSWAQGGETALGEAARGLQLAAPRCALHLPGGEVQGGGALPWAKLPATQGPEELPPGLGVWLCLGPASSPGSLGLPSHGELTQALMEHVAELHTRGYPLSWQVLYPAASCRRTPLPSYPFQRRRYWLDAQKKSRRTH